MKIAWCDRTVQVTLGCTKCSRGCEHCYAERLSARLVCMAPAARAAGRFRQAQRMELYARIVEPSAEHIPPDAIGKIRWAWNGRVVCLGDEGLADLRIGGKPKRVFVNSMADLFHEGVPHRYLEDVFATMRRQPRHTFLVLTKRALRAREFGQSRTLSASPVGPNTLVGYSIEDQAAFDERSQWAEAYAVQWISAEPLIGPIDLFSQTGRGCRVQDWLLWLVIGCEPGPGRRRCELAWVRELIRQADELRIPVFVKQLEIDGRVSHDPAAWPEWARRREWPEVRADQRMMTPSRMGSGQHSAVSDRPEQRPPPAGAGTTERPVQSPAATT